MLDSEPDVFFLPWVVPSGQTKPACFDIYVLILSSLGLRCHCFGVLAGRAAGTHTCPSPVKFKFEDGPSAKIIAENHDTLFPLCRA
jgi:hypothetical protein